MKGQADKGYFKIILLGIFKILTIYLATENIWYICKILIRKIILQYDMILGHQAKHFV